MAPTVDFGSYVPPPIPPSFAQLSLSLPPSAASLAPQIAQEWLSRFSASLAAHDIPAVLDCLVPDAYWKDMLSLTWDFRVFSLHSGIAKFLEDRLELCEVKGWEMSDLVEPKVVSLGEWSWVQGSAAFETKWGRGTLIFRLVPFPAAPPAAEEGEVEWRAFALFTNLDSLHDVTEKVGAQRTEHPPRMSWHEFRRRELEFVDKEPEVLIIGGGHNGLMTAARLQYMGISCLVVEKEPRVGNQWRGRYASLCTHDPVWFTQLPYLPFPSTWPSYTPADKLGDWLESYSSHLDLNIWTSSLLQTVSYSPSTRSWTAHILRGSTSGEHELRVLRPKHVVYAAGWNGVPYQPKVRGREEFEEKGGKVLHSSEYRNAEGFKGKRVVVIGSGVSAHDIAQDLYNSGAASVTLHQRSSTLVVSTIALRQLLNRSGFREDGLPVDTADLLMHSLPMDIQKLTMAENSRMLRGIDQQTLEGLEKRGFMLHDGPEGAGYLFLVLTRRGGYYFDVGASQMIIDGKIGLKAGGEVSHLSPGEIHFTDSTSLPADIVVFATGFGPIKDNLVQTFGEEFVSGLKDPWYLDEEGELRAVWRGSGREQFWYMIGNLSYARFYSKRVALQIKAQLSGAWDGVRYSIPEKSKNVSTGLEAAPKEIQNGAPEGGIEVNGAAK